MVTSLAVQVFDAAVFGFSRTVNENIIHVHYVPSVSNTNKIGKNIQGDYCCTFGLLKYSTIFLSENPKWEGFQLLANDIWIFFWEHDVANS